MFEIIDLYKKSGYPQNAENGKYAENFIIFQNRLKTFLMTKIYNIIIKYIFK